MNHARMPTRTGGSSRAMPIDVGDEPGWDEQDPGHEDQEPVDDFAVRYPSVRDRVLQPDEHGDTLALHHPDADDR